MGKQNELPAMRPGGKPVKGEPEKGVTPIEVYEAVVAELYEAFCEPWHGVHGISLSEAERRSIAQGIVSRVFGHSALHPKTRK
jgi:hypothetical protein